MVVSMEDMCRRMRCASGLGLGRERARGFGIEGA